MVGKISVGQGAQEVTGCINRKHLGRDVCDIKHLALDAPDAQDVKCTEMEEPDVQDVKPLVLDA